MARHLNDEQLRELNHLKEWCTSILQFEKALYAPAPSEGGLLEIVERTYLESDLRGMRFPRQVPERGPQGLVAKRETEGVE